MKYTCTLGQNYYSDPRYRNVTFAVLISIFVFHVYAHQVTGFVEMVPNEDTNENKELRGLAASIWDSRRHSPPQLSLTFSYFKIWFLSLILKKMTGVW